MAGLVKENIDKWFEYNLDIENRVIYLGSIDKHGVTDDEPGINHLTFEMFMKGMHVLESKNNHNINIIMNTPGGDHCHGMAIYDTLKNAKSHCTIKVYGQAMSMGSIILQAADHRIMMPNSRFMIHYGHVTYGENSIRFLEKWVDEEKRLTKDMEEIYLKVMLDKEEKEGHGYLAKTLSTILKSPKTFYKKPETKKEELRSVLKEMLNFDTILTAQETVDLGFADEVYKP